MAKRRKSRSNKKTFLGRVVGFFSLLFQLVIKITPTALACGLAFFVFLGVKKALYADPGLTISQVLFEPYEELGNREKEQLESQLFGKNLFKINLPEIQRRVEDHPSVLRAIVTKNFPDTLKVQIQRRSPSAAVRLEPKGVYAITAEDGMVLDILSKRPGSFVVVEAFDTRYKRFNLGRILNISGLVSAIQFIKDFQQLEMLREEKLSKITLDRLGHTSILLGSGPEIRLGRDPQTKLQSLENLKPILAGAGRFQIDYIDLQYDQVVVKKKK